MDIDIDASGCSQQTFDDVIIWIVERGIKCNIDDCTITLTDVTDADEVAFRLTFSCVPVTD